MKGEVSEKLSYYKKLIAIPFLLLVVNASATYVFIDDPLIEAVEELRVRGVSLVRYPNIRSYFFREFPKQEGVNDWLISRLSCQDILKATVYIDSVSTTQLNAYLTYTGDFTDIFVQPLIKFSEDRSWPTYKFKGEIAADYERGFIRVTPGDFSFTLGRERFAMGPSPRYNLLLSGYSPPMDGLFWSYEASKFKLSFFFSRLEDVWGDTLEWENDVVPDTITAYVRSRRFLTIRRVDFLPKDWINIGLTEAVIYGGPNRLPDIYYLNPLTLNYPYQSTRPGLDDNIFWGIDARLDFPNFAIYSEFIIDDYQYGSNTQRDPQQTGFLIGFEVADPLGFRNTFFWGEYTRVTRWVYTYFVPSQRYEYLGFPIGHPLGPDFDNIFAKIKYHLSPEMDLFSEISYTRHGEGTVDALWPIPDPERVEGTYFPENNFLSGEVNAYFDMTLGVDFFKLPWVFASAKLGFSKPSYDKGSPTFKLMIKLRR